MSLFVPTYAQLQARARYESLLAHGLEITEKLKYWNRELKKIDPYLELVKAQNNTRHPALKPGYYHIFHHRPGGIPNVIVHQGDQGEFREPDSGLLEMLKRGDTWSDRSMKERKRLQKQAERAQRRQEERESNDRLDEITERLKSRNGTSVLVPRGV